jgi:two-component system, sensor histidine kinase and response regulator
MTELSEINILVVEDSPTQALLLCNSLKKKGIKVDLVKNGKEAIAFLSTKQPSIIISDITMPEMNGFELCKAVRSNKTTSNLPIILFTALYDTDEVLNAIESGANFFLTKPSRPELILEIAKDAIENGERNVQLHPITFAYAGNKRSMNVDLNKVTSLLLSTYSNAIEKSKALELAQRELKEKNIQLDLLNQQKNTFLGMAAHDLRNPLSVIQGFCELLEDDIKEKITPEELEMIQTIHHSSESILALVNELLDVSVIESGHLELKIETVNILEIFEKNLKITKGLAEKKEIELTLQIDGEIPFVDCDAKKIEEILTNFLTNAIKYSEPKTHVTVKISAQNNEFYFSVTDEGQGIPQDEQNQLFKTFSKTTVQTTAGETSTGLGLAIVKKIIKAHGGELGCESEVGKGSTFFAKIPLKQQSRAA